MTAVIVAHDGAAWLPKLADAVLGQTRPVQRVVAVDTGSRDRGGAVLASRFGQQAVFGMDRSTGYGAAIARALHHRAANTQVPRPPAGGAGQHGLHGQGSQSGDRIEWLWLLHDDCEPAPDALEQLLRGTVETSTAAVLGPKLRDWSNRDVILEAGLTLDTATRRLTGIEPREVDQGQHDGDRDALAVSSAGMLVRRDVWEQVGGFDRGMGLFMEDIDFCWRVHAAGYRVRVITDAVVYHVRAATKHMRPISVGRRARMLDRRNGLLTLLGNLPFRHMVTAAAGNICVSLLRVTIFLLAKRLTAAVDELSALTSVLCHPFRLIRMRGARARGRRSAYSRVRADVPPGRSGRRLLEFMMGALSKSQPDTSGAHHATDDPTEDDSMLIDNGLGRRLLSSPSLLTFVSLLAVAIAAGGSLLGSGPLGGGSLVPAWGGASDLWATYVQSFHPAGIGSTTPAPTWLAVIATLSTVLAGKPWLAIDVLLIGCVPLAGMTAMLAVRKVTTSAPVRVWASATYALLPVATGVVASGRFGTAIAFILLPLIVVQACRMVTESGPRAGRAAWATGLLVAIGGAFVPLLWLILAIGCVLVALVVRGSRRGMLRNLAIAALSPLVLLLPWTVTLLSHPAQLLLEAGLPQQGDPIFGLPARSLMLLSPGGPGMPPYWVTAGLVVVAFAALFASRRRPVIIAGWGLALTGLLAAAVTSHLVVQPDDGGQIAVWAGLPLALAAIGLLLAAAAGADVLGRRAGGQGWRAALSGRGPRAALLGLIACSAPVLAAATWISDGVIGPVHPVSNPVVPELVAVAAGQARQVRTLVLRSDNGHVSYLLLRGPSPSLADAALTPPADAQRALSKTVSALATPDGGLAANQAQLLADFDVGFILVQSPVGKQLATVLNNVSGLHPYSTTSSYSLWQLDTTPARVSVLKPDGTVAPIPAGQVGVPAVSLPATGGTLMLAEPAGGWSASLNGRSLDAVPSPAGSWAQAYRLPKGGGTLTVGHPGLTRDLLVLFELLAFLVVASLALPGIKVDELEAHVAPRASAAEGGHAAGRKGARVPAGAARDATALVPAAHRAAGAGAVRAGSQGLARSARGKAARARAMAGGRARGGRAPAGGTLPDAGEATEGTAAAGVTASSPGARRTPDRRRAGEPDGAERTSRPREDSRLAEAWPYASADEDRQRARDDRLAAAWPYAPPDEGPLAGRGTGRSADARPYATAGEPGTGTPRRSGQRPYPAAADDDRGGTRRGDPLTGDWPDARERDSGRADYEDYAATGRSGEPRHAGELEYGGGRRGTSAGRSPSGRSAAGDWPNPDLDADWGRERGGPARRSPSGRSASGAWPEPGRPDEHRSRQDPYVTDPYLPDPYLPDPYAGPREPTGEAARDRPRRPGSRGSAVSEPRSSSGQSAYGEPERGRDYGTHRGADRESDSGWRGDSGARDWPGRDNSASARENDGRERRERRGGHSRGRRSRRGGEERPARSFQPERDDWMSGEQPAVWSGGAGELEPLPPLEDPGGSRAGRSAEYRGRGRPDDLENPDPRWADPLPQFEPEYEGDAW